MALINTTAKEWHLKLCNLANYRMTRGVTSNDRANITIEIIRISHVTNGKTMKAGEEPFKFLMEIEC